MGSAKTGKWGTYNCVSRLTIIEWWTSYVVTGAKTQEVEVVSDKMFRLRIWHSVNICHILLVKEVIKSTRGHRPPLPPVNGKSVKKFEAIPNELL